MAHYTNKPDFTEEAPLTTRYVVVDAGDGEAIVMDRTTDLPILTVSGRIYIAPTENARWTADRMNLTASIAPEAAPVAPVEEVESDEEIDEIPTGDLNPFADAPEYAPEESQPVTKEEYAAQHAAPKPNPAALLHVATLPEPVEEPRPRPVSALTSAVLRIESAPENLADWERDLLGLPLAESESVPALDTFDFETGTPDGLENATQAHVRSQEWRNTMADTWRLGAYRAGAKMAEKRLRKVQELASALPEKHSALKWAILETLHALESGRETAEDENPYV